MTNREWCERKIHAMSSDEFARMLLGAAQPDGFEMQVHYGRALCAWCEATHGGCHHVEDCDCPVTDDDYLRSEAIA